MAKCYVLLILEFDYKSGLKYERAMFCGTDNPTQELTKSLVTTLCSSEADDYASAHSKALESVRSMAEFSSAWMTVLDDLEASEAQSEASLKAIGILKYDR